jgi:putative transposase
VAIDKEVLDKLLPKYEKPEDLIGEDELLRQLTKALMERALEAEMTTHLGYEKHAPSEKPGENRRNGKSRKTLTS